MTFSSCWLVRHRKERCKWEPSRSKWTSLGRSQARRSGAASNQLKSRSLLPSSDNLLLRLLGSTQFQARKRSRHQRSSNRTPKVQAHPLTRHSNSNQTRTTTTTTVALRIKLKSCSRAFTHSSSRNRWLRKLWIPLTILVRHFKSLQMKFWKTTVWSKVKKMRRKLKVNSTAKPAKRSIKLVYWMWASYS